ncbi:sporulation protein [Micromonospora zhanjiangensis]|uniref:Sporulation protein n=1 Tax=Micromonospora zhanjiangensis TaxID=1522057 RepID=A0ABV8KH71_9ACTN
MVFRRMLWAMGADGPAVATTVDDATCRPGGRLAGRVRMVGGDHPVDISYLAVGLLTRVAVVTGDSEYDATEEFHRERVAGPLRLAAGERREFAFGLAVPHQTPLTRIRDRPLPGVTLGLRTELAVARAVDESELEPVTVLPTPEQEQILAALWRLGFRFAGATVERGHLYGVRQEVPFHQEFEFVPPDRYGPGVHRLDLTFVAGPERLELLLEIDRRGGVLTGGRDGFDRLTVDRATAAGIDWSARLDDWVRRAVDRRDRS